MRQFTPILVLLAAVCIWDCVPSQAAPDPQNGDRSIIKSEEATTSGPSIEIVEKRIDLGDISPETDIIEGSILFINTGDEPLRVNKVDGPCACFAGYSGDKILQPEQGGEIQVKFDKSKIPAGQVKRMVRVKTNDPVNEAVEVYFHFNVQRDPIEEELRVIRQEMSNLNKELKAVRADLKKVLNELNAATKDKQAKKKTPDTTVYNVNIGSSPALGPENAPVTIVEFSDFQCPYCAREYPKIEQILKDYPGKVRVVFKHYPLKFHKKAKPAHAAAELAKLQGGQEKFWKMHDMIMDNPKDLEIADLRGYAQTLGMDLARFDKVVADEKQIDELLATDVSEARKCKVTGTPTILINGLKMTKREISDYKARIDQILSKDTAQK
jgi:protein-disulfide isomerase